jgi:ribose transport system ATP-binding protein
MKVVFKNINKSFNQVKVLDNVSLTIDGGIHAIMGENGAGKSTLMKVMSGLYQADSGSVVIDGTTKQYKSLSDAEKDGIFFIHQELSILSNMSVSENMFLNKELKKGFILDKKLMDEKTKEYLNELGLDVDVTKKAGSCSIGQQQIIEIARVLKENAKMIIMDEPTAALTEKETDRLFALINDLKARGITIIYISHRMEEIFKLSDAISVLRDGAFVGTKKTSETNNEEIIKMMVNREIHDVYPKKETHYDSEVVLKVANISKKGQYQNISFELHKGEILGFAGLMGSGRTEIMHGIFGSVPYDSGSIYVNGIELKNTIKNSIENKIAFITEDRKSEGIITDFMIKDNIILTNLDSIKDKVKIKGKKQKELANKYVDMLQIKCSSINHLLKKMSGGNQQKVVIGKWLNIGPDILIMDEPTRGVDVGAKQEIYNIIKTLCEEQGMAIILVSSEMPEVIGMSDRICVLHEGKLMGVLDKENVSQEAIMALATGGLK